MVAHLREVLAEPVDDRIHHDRGQETAELVAHARQRVVLGVDDGDVVAVLLREGDDAVGQRPGLVLTGEHDDAGVLLDELERAVEELGGVDAGDLRALAARFLPVDRVDALFADAAPRGAAGSALAAVVEHELAAVIGAGSARLLLQVVHRQRQDELDTVAAIVGEATEDLRFNQRVLEAALETMSQGICVVDADLRLVAWNRPYADLFGYPADMLRVGRPAADLVRHNIAGGLIGPGDVDARVERRMAWMRSGSPHLAERRFPDGTVVEIRGNPMPGGGYVATFTDVTSFRETEEELIRTNETLELRVAERTVELQRATAEARQANEAKSHFLTAVSHDLLQPLHAAQLFAHALRTGHGDAETARHLDGALAATEDLLAGLLDIARLEGGRLSPRIVDVALAEVLGPLAAEGRALAAERGIRFHCVPTRAWVRTDPQLLRRVVQNFLADGRQGAMQHVRSSLHLATPLESDFGYSDGTWPLTNQPTRRPLTPRWRPNRKI